MNTNDAPIDEHSFASRGDNRAIITYLWLTVMVVLWGLSWPLTKMALSIVPPLWLAAIRFGSAAVCLFLFLVLRGKLRLPLKQDWPIILSMGGLQMMAFTGLGMIAMVHTDTSRAVLLAYTTPLWAILMGWLFLRQAPTKIQLIALLLGLSGIMLICSPSEMDWQAPGVLWGSGLLLIASICWSFVILHIRHHHWRSSPLALAPWQMLIACIPLGGSAYYFEGSPLSIPLTLHLFGLLFFIGPIATSVCFVISAEYGRKISPFEMSTFTSGVPLVGIVFSMILFGNTMSNAFFTGLALILCSVITVALRPRKNS